MFNKILYNTFAFCSLLLSIIPHRAPANTAPWFTTIKNKKFLRFDYNKINTLLTQATQEIYARNIQKKYRFFISNDPALSVKGFVKKNSIDEVEQSYISDSLFLVFFHTDDDYFYTLKKIKDHNGQFFSLPSYHPKVRYVWVDKHAAQAIDETFSQGSKVSHLTLEVHETICLCLNATKHLEGDYVEIGVYKGGSALTALNYMQYAQMPRKSYFIDTFNGMTYEEAYQSSDVLWKDTHILWGVAETMNHVRRVLNPTGQDFTLVPANICSDPLPHDLKKIAVCNLDVDLYEATLASLLKVAPLMVKGGIIICEDPTSTPGLGGALVAMEEFLSMPIGKKFVKTLTNAQYLLIKVED